MTMTRQLYETIEAYMRAQMADSAHDCQHVYRVLYNALEIAKTQPDTDLDILITACLLHDIGRPAQIADGTLCHAAVGSEKALQHIHLSVAGKAEMTDASFIFIAAPPPRLHAIGVAAGVSPVPVTSKQSA